MTELTWDGKYRDGKRVAPIRLALPFQTVETVNESTRERQRSLDLFARGAPTEWRNRLIWGDKKYVLPSLLAEFAGKVNLVYIDPPFNTGTDFSITTGIPESGKSFSKEPSVIEQKAYRDTWGRGLDSFLQWFYETVTLLRELLAENGSIYVHLDWHVVHYAKIVMDEVFGEKSFRTDVIWRYRRWPAKTPNLQRMHDTILYYIKTPEKPRFNVLYEELAESTKKTFGTKKQVADFSSGHRKPSQVDEQTPGAPLSDVWDIGVIAPSGHERVGYPTQKPEELLQRVLEVSSSENDLILDCFCGSGTTAVVAEKLGRRWIACDLGRFAIHTARKRLLSLADVKPFVVQNLGKYERQEWMKAEFDKPEDRAPIELAYRTFILELFKAQPFRSGAWIHGMKAGRMVHVGPVDAPVTLADVKAITEEASSLAGGNTKASVDVLGWEFAFELNEAGKDVAAEAHADIQFRQIPRDVLDERAKKDIQASDFFELRALSAQITAVKLRVRVELIDFILPPDDLPEEVQKAIEHWSQWIDYWAVDWNFRNDTFHNEWQSYRTKEAPQLDWFVEHDYAAPGEYMIVVKVIDILGNDTTKRIRVEVK